MSWGLWVHAGDVAKEGVPALLTISLSNMYAKMLIKLNPA